MKLKWIEWAGGILTRDDGYTIYKDLRFAMLREPSGTVTRCRDVNDAKRRAGE